MRKFLVFLLLPAAAGAQNAARGVPGVFRACAYTSSVSPAPPEVGIELSPDRPYRLRELIRLKVSSDVDGYVYLFQNPADPAPLVYPRKPAPGKPADDHRISKSGAWSLPMALRFTNSKTQSILVAVSPEPIPNIEKLSLDDVRQFFRQRRFCDGYSLTEKAIRFQD